MILGLIPSRLKSKRLKEKALIEIDRLPMIVHTFKRTMLSKKLDKVIVCTDSPKIKSIVEKHGGESILTKKTHINGTERIAEVAKKYNSKLVIDIQGDEPLVSPVQIDKLIDFHLKNEKFDIVLPSLAIQSRINNPNIVKIVSSRFNKVLYFSRAQIPFSFTKIAKQYYKHLSIISFKPNKLQEYKKLKRTKLEKIENVELLRALENDFNIGTYSVKRQSTAVDVYNDLERVIALMKNDPFRKYY